MSDVLLASNLLKELSLPRPPGEFVRNAIDRSARLAKLTYWRGFDLWYRKARRVEQYELDQIREALRIKNERAARNIIKNHNKSVKGIKSMIPLEVDEPPAYEPPQKKSTPSIDDLLKKYGGK